MIEPSMKHRLARLILVLTSTLTATASAENTRSKAICRNGTGTHGGYFYSFFRDAGAGCMTLGRRGRYAVTWKLGASGNLVAGKGWEQGSKVRVIGYNANVNPGSNGYISLYGWSTAPLVEYYVVDSWGDFTPPGGGAALLGSFDADGGTYRIYRTQRIGQPSIIGVATFDQYWSVRTTRRPPGTNARITFARHVSAWQRAGMSLGAMNYQILATEGFGSMGDSNVSVWQYPARPSDR